MSNSQKTYALREFAEITGQSLAAVRQQAHRGTLPTELVESPVGSYRLVSQVTLDEWRAQQGEPTSLAEQPTVDLEAKAASPDDEQLPPGPGGCSGPGNKKDRARMAALSWAQQASVQQLAASLYDGTRTVASCYKQALAQVEASL